MNRREFLTALAGTSASPLTGCGIFHASDETMIAWFRKNEKRFNQLVEMARAEPTVRRVAPDFLKTDDLATYSYPELPSDFSLERWDTYRKFFRDLRLEMGIEFWSLEEVRLYATTFGIVVSGSMKGYVWSRRLMEPLVDSLDPPLPSAGDLPGDNYMAYRAISPSWYLVYEAS